ncbi:unnamed protein product, partial [Trichobilharzia regenti]
SRIRNKSICDIFPSCDTASLDITLYHQARWKLGLPEGVEEFITNDTLPFEANTDLSGGVSFSKGCYIGQELTARTHFTGVIRRRYVPVKIIAIGNADLLKSPNTLKLASVGASRLLGWSPRDSLKRYWIWPKIVVNGERVAISFFLPFLMIVDEHCLNLFGMTVFLADEVLYPFSAPMFLLLIYVVLLLLLCGTSS